MDVLRPVLDQEFAGNLLLDWLIAAGIALGITIGLHLIVRGLVGRLRKWSAGTTTYLDDAFVAVVESTRFSFWMALGTWFGLRRLHLTETADRWSRIFIFLIVLLQLGLALQSLVRYVAEHWRARHETDGGARTMAAALTFLLSLSIWSVLFVTALSTLGFEISALIAGLGVGGVAAALAVQSVAADLIASLSIYLDRPFDIGDFIIVGSEKGTVDHIGLRTTRLRSLDGEELIFANGDLTKSRIRNCTRMSERRVAFGLAVEYGTAPEELERIPQLIQDMIEARQGLRFDRAHFKACGDFSLNFEVVYFVLSPDYKLYLDHQQAINLAILREFKARNIQFASPNKMLLLDGQGRSSARLPETDLDSTDLDSTEATRSGGRLRG